MHNEYDSTSDYQDLLLTDKATITRRDLSARFFCIDDTLLCEFKKAVRYESTSLNRIVAD